MVNSENDHAAEHIERRHKRHQFFTHTCNGFYAAEYYERSENSNDNTNDPGIDTEIGITYFRNGVYLSCTADSKGSESREYRENHSQPFHVQPALQRVHGAALHTAVRCLHTVFYRDQGLSIFGSDTEHTGQPAPEYGSGAAKGDSCSNADDIPRSDRGRQRGCQGSELAYFAVSALLFCDRKGNPFCNRLPLDEPGPDRQEHMSSKQKSNHAPAPYEIIDRLDHTVNLVIHCTVLLTLISQLISSQAVLLIRSARSADCF